MDVPDSVQVTLDLKFLRIAGTWKPNQAERLAAWELYVELITRIGVVPLKEGLLREALSSLYSIFSTTRDILRRHGPEVATPRGKNELNFGYLAVAVLNRILRPMLSTWHPILTAWESHRSPTASQFSHELAWDQAVRLREEIDATGRELHQLANTLAAVCGVPDLSDDPRE